MKNYLLDTHTLIWYPEANPALSKKAKEIVDDLTQVSYVSHVSLFEIAIKLTIGKLTLQIAFADLEKKLIKDGFVMLPISSAHLVAYTQLALHHRDPFDRLLIAQAFVESFPVLGADEKFDFYPIQRIW